jgi:hypothetical protein
LLVVPDGCDRLLNSDANSAATPNGGPVCLSLDGKSNECVVECGGNALELFKSMAGSDGKPETLLATSDGGEINGLNVYAMPFEKIVGCLLGLDGITNQNGYDMAGSGYDGDATVRKALLHLADIPLHELTVTIIRFLIDNRSVGTGDRDGRERSREDEAWGIRPNHVDELGRTGNITANCAVCFAKSTYRNI